MGVELGMRLLLRLSWVVCTSVVLMYTVLVLLAAAPLRLVRAPLEDKSWSYRSEHFQVSWNCADRYFFSEIAVADIGAVLLIVGENIGVSLELPLAQSGRSHGSKVECLEFYASYSIGQRAGELGGCSVGESETLVSDHPAREGTEYQTNGRRTIGRSLRLYMGAPIWGMFVVVVAWPAMSIARTVVRRQRRARGKCVQCAYDLRGCCSGVCPECGAPTESSCA